ncbi:MAG: T9SS type A sorting domain-containing protein [Bacteroidetes bacterium]|nr:T9SS type A sorting domain-containing protein [Bacteroidota bacterium]
MKKLHYLLLLIFCSASITLFGQLTAGWDFDPLPGGTGNFGPSPYDATSTGTNVTVGGLTRGSGVTTLLSGAANAWGGNGWDGATDLSTAVSLGNFVTFTITPNSGYTLSFSSIDFYNIRRSSTGPTTGQWQYRIGTGLYNNIGSPITWGSNTSSAGNPQSLISLTGITNLQNISPGTIVTFRVVNWNASGNTGTWYFNDPNGTFGDDLIINASESLFPVELTDFKANQNQGNMYLTWQTASELNNSLFSIEKSTNSFDFKEIGVVSGNGTSTETHNYSFIDYFPVAGNNYYRLRQEDFDGHIEYSKVVNVFYIDAKQEISLYPTLANNVITLQFGEPTKIEGTIQIFDLNGKLFEVTKFESDISEFTLPIDDLPTGNYFTKIQAGRTFQTLRFTKF